MNKIAKIKYVVNKEIMDKLDHCYLNDLIGNPTAENIPLA